MECVACLGEGIIKKAQCPWCFGTKNITIEIARVYWSVRQLSPFEFHSVFGERVEKEKPNFEEELSKLKEEPKAKIDWKLLSSPSSDTHCMKCGNLKS